MTLRAVNLRRNTIYYFALALVLVSVCVYFVTAYCKVFYSDNPSNLLISECIASTAWPEGSREIRQWRKVCWQKTEEWVAYNINDESKFKNWIGSFGFSTEEIVGSITVSTPDPMYHAEIVDGLVYSNIKKGEPLAILIAYDRRSGSVLIYICKRTY